MPRKFSTSEQQRISSDLIKEGIEHFSRYGVQHVTVDQLVIKVGISKGAFYHFFDSKMELYTKVLETIQQTVDEETENLIIDKQKRPERILMSLIRYSQEIRQRYRPLIEAESYLIDEQMSIRISGELVVRTITSLDISCDFSPKAIEEVLKAVGSLSFGDGEDEGRRLLQDVLDTGFSAFLRY